MQNDLISRSALWEQYKTEYQHADALGNAHRKKGWQGALQLLYDAPAVDAVSVVRCGECTHRVYKEIGDCTIGGCELLGVALPCDFYCANGERRADDGKL